MRRQSEPELSSKRIPLAILALLTAGAAWLSLPGRAQSGDQAASLLRNYHWRSIGPASAGGRITDVRALDTDFRYAIVAAASGGVWKTVNAGTTGLRFSTTTARRPSAQSLYSRPNPQILWVGTGESNNRNSVAWGDGIYKSTDGGQSFQNMGLKDTFQIARVVTHPTDPQTVYVAAVGNLWGYTGDRGVFKTTDGGQTWQKLTSGLPNDGKTGATDLVMDPERSASALRRLLSTAAASRGDSIAAARMAASSRPPMAARHGRSSPTDCRRRHWPHRAGYLSQEPKDRHGHRGARLPMRRWSRRRAARLLRLQPRVRRHD